MIKKNLSYRKKAKWAKVRRDAKNIREAIKFNTYKNLLDDKFSDQRRTAEERFELYMNLIKLTEESKTEEFVDSEYNKFMQESRDAYKKYTNKFRKNVKFAEKRRIIEEKLDEESIDRYTAADYNEFIQESHDAYMNKVRKDFHVKFAEERRILEEKFELYKKENNLDEQSSDGYTAADYYELLQRDHDAYMNKFEKQRRTAEEEVKKLNQNILHEGIKANLTEGSKFNEKKSKNFFSEFLVF